MGLTLLSQEPCKGVGNLSTGNFTTVTGTIPKRPCGPKLAGDSTANGQGWSLRFDCRLPSTAQSAVYSLSSSPGSGAATLGALGWWHYFDAPLNPTANNNVIAQWQNTIAQGAIVLQLDPATNVLAATGIGITQTNILTAPYRNWIWLVIEWSISGTSNVNFWAMRQGIDAVPVKLFTSTFNPNGSPGSIGLYDNGSTFGFQGRIGMPSLYSCGTLGDAGTYPSAIIPPPTGPFGWYWDIVNGNDGNDGTTPQTARLSPAALLDELNGNNQQGGCGIFGRLGMGLGDTLNILNATIATPLDFGATSLNIHTPGLTLQGNQPMPGLAGPVTINDVSHGAVQNVWWVAKCWRDISGASWTLSAGSSHTYQTTDGGATDLTSIVVWENDGTGDKWLNHPTGANFAAVQATLDATPGSFYSDGTNIYLHPFGSTVPGGDGKIYTRSRAMSGGSLLGLNAPYWTIKGLYAGKTCLAASTDNSGVAYVVLTDTNNLINNQGLLQDCYFYFGATHCLGFVETDVSRHFTCVRVQCEQGSPYQGSSPFVDYTGTQGDGSSTTLYINCVSNAAVGLIGSTAGTSYDGSGNALDSWFSHNTVSGSGPGQYAWTYADITFQGCYFNGALESAGTSNTVHVTQSTFWGPNTIQTKVLTVDQSTILNEVPGCPINQSQGFVYNYSNSIIKPSQRYLRDSAAGYLEDTVSYIGCTFDMTGAQPPPSGNVAPIFQQYATLHLTLRNNLFLIPQLSSGVTYGLFQNGTTASTFTLDHNEFMLGGGTTLFFAYNDGTTTSNRTLAQLAALGIDIGSTLLSYATIDPQSYRRLDKPTVTHNLGAGADLTGKVYRKRQTPGAYETNYDRPLVHLA